MFLYLLKFIKVLFYTVNLCWIVDNYFYTKSNQGKILHLFDYLLNAYIIGFHLDF